MLEVRDLELVESIVTQGNFARAARVLGIGHPVLTRRLADLERRLGGALFVRSKRGAQQTDLCRAVLTDAGDILERMRQLERRLAEVRGKQTRDLRIAAGGYAAETCVLPAAGAMLGQDPRLRIHVSSMNWSDVLVAVREREAELGVLELSELGDAADLVIEPLQRHPGFFLGRPGHPLAARDTVSLTDMLAFPFVFIEKAPTRVIAPFAAAREAAHARGDAHPAFPAAVHESPIAALRFISASDAVMVVTGPIAEMAVRAGLAMILPWPHEPWATTNFGIIRARGRSPSPGSVAFVECLRTADRAAFETGRALLEQVARGRM